MRIFLKVTESKIFLKITNIIKFRIFLTKFRQLQLNKRIIILLELYHTTEILPPVLHAQNRFHIFRSKRLSKYKYYKKYGVQPEMFLIIMQIHRSPHGSSLISQLFKTSLNLNMCKIAYELHEYISSNTEFHIFHTFRLVTDSQFQILCH